MWRTIGPGGSRAHRGNPPASPKLLGVTARGLVGRTAEQRAAAAAVQQVRGGENAVLALFGAPGIGKTALLSDLEAHARTGGLDVLVGRAAEHEVDVPFGLVVDALDDRVYQLGAARLES